MSMWRATTPPEELCGYSLRHLRLQVRCEGAEEFPADLLLLSTSKDSGMCYVETSNLDGETSLKIRKAADVSKGLLTADQLGAVAGAYLEYEQPNNRLYTFEGTLSMAGCAAVPIDANATVLRGSVLRNTAHVVGLVIYAGEVRTLRLLCICGYTCYGRNFLPALPTFLPTYYLLAYLRAYYLLAQESKLAKNSVPARSKQSYVVRLINRHAVVSTEVEP